MRLWHCDTVTLWHCDTVTLWRYGAVTLWRCGTVILWRCGTVTLWNCDTVTLWHCDTVTLWHCDAVTLWHCDAVAGNDSSRDTKWFRSININFEHWRLYIFLWHCWQLCCMVQQWPWPCRITYCVLISMLLNELNVVLLIQIKAGETRNFFVRGSVRFVVDEVIIGQVSVRTSVFPCQLPSHHYPLFIHISSPASRVGTSAAAVLRSPFPPQECCNNNNPWQSIGNIYVNRGCNLRRQKCD